MNRIAALVLEVIWLALAILSLVAGVVETLKNGFARSYIFFILVCITVFMYLYRRNKRLRGPGNSGV